jgi:L,D-peptidoglycan transpeptidase YkuD (ErfK/YbiS/YcfS/YnhG family)
VGEVGKPAKRRQYNAFFQERMLSAATVSPFGNRSAMINKEEDYLNVTDHAGGVRIAILAVIVVACVGEAQLPLQFLPSLQGADRASRALDHTTQLVVVTTANWNAVDGLLHVYERATRNASWSAVGVDIPVVVGRNGLAWGTGLHGQPSTFANRSDPIKKEGDGKAPAGVFRLSAAFGYAASDPAQRGSLPYIPVTSTLECVDDPDSVYYNRIVDRATTSGKWRSSEHMQRSDDLYRWGIVVDNNTNPTVPKDGSCIFLHVWSGPGNGTDGCTAMPEADVKKLVAWLDPKKRPLLVQLPETELNRYKAKWGLPS